MAAAVICIVIVSVRVVQAGARDRKATTGRRSISIAPREPGKNSTITARYQRRIIRGRVRHFPEKIVALTFDDGPSVGNTQRVLDILAAHKVHATFFVIGRQAKAYPNLVRRIAAGGHAIGNHSYNHNTGATNTQAPAELQRTFGVIRDITGRGPSLFRPPCGVVRNKLTQEALMENYTAVTWTVSSADTLKITPQVMVNNVTHGINSGDIILTHDGPGHGTTVKALPAILDSLKRQGYTLVTVPELLERWDRWKTAQERKEAAKAAAQRTNGVRAQGG